MDKENWRVEFNGWSTDSKWKILDTYGAEERACTAMVQYIFQHPNYQFRVVQVEKKEG